jgi:hypothetical protein
MVKRRNLQPPPAKPPVSQVVNLTVLDTTQYNSLLARIDRMERYIESLSKTYEIRDGDGNEVRF